MERKTLGACVTALLLLQIPGLSEASEASLQNIDNHPENVGLSPDSPTSDDQSVSGTTVTGVPADQERGSDELDDSDRSGKLIAQYTTKTKALFATTTKTALSTCFSATNVACTAGKRKKRSLEPDNLFIVNGSSSDLVSSQAADIADGSEYEFKDQGDEKRQKRKFTIWTTLFSTHTLTSTFYYPGTTVTISGVCSVPGLANSCFG